MTTIRIATSADLPRIARLVAETFHLACPPSTSRDDLQRYVDTELTTERFARHLETPTKSLFVADTRGTPVVGYLMLCREERPKEFAAASPLELRRLYVLPAFHGIGVAAALMDEALHSAVDADHHVMWLTVSVAYGRAIRFYNRYRFAVVGQRSFTAEATFTRTTL